MNRRFSEDSKTSTADVVQRLDASLRRSLELRTQHVREALSPELLDVGSINARVAVLFSGGLDCSILARICHDLLPLSETVDLLNVAFENPRIHSNLEPGASPYELCPDRITGRSTYEELCEVCPGRRWQFVEVNVPYTETAAHRTTVMTLMHPHNTEMDLSIAYALYFLALVPTSSLEATSAMLLHSRARVILVCLMNLPSTSTVSASVISVGTIASSVTLARKSASHT
jgi:asparagine synthetase B (glutamine-hydrolysing)